MIKIGTSGFSFPDWRGVIYPKTLQPKDILLYYQEDLGFDCVEINATYYTLLSDKSFVGMEKKTNPGFEFVVKGYKGFTHDPFDTRLAEKKPNMEKALEDMEKFNYSVQPLKEKNKLGAILLQFPVFFYPTDENKEYITICKDKFQNIPLIIEFRNHDWAKTEIFDFLKQNNLGFCIVDEPKLPRLMPFINEVTSDTGYFRLHGRNPNWFNVSIQERYDYLYSDKELKSFIPEIEKMTKKTKKTYAMFNNCHAGSAARNALSLKKLLNIKSVKRTLF
ncbi:MAG: hypothetical protein A2539_01395 [Elusimicrobia bacterium RIFOXYD2_FULL_34_15]|nr:MAG: hypothetical protein A2539_01395 [Elusimicrobia bacterium RIFOXYD2_FULL_34_15]